MWATESHGAVLAVEIDDGTTELTFKEKGETRTVSVPTELLREIGRSIVLEPILAAAMREQA